MRSPACTALEGPSAGQTSGHGRGQKFSTSALFARAKAGNMRVSSTCGAPDLANTGAFPQDASTACPDFATSTS
eukprot:8100943-Pyramimonas_sp.AAC.1